VIGWAADAGMTASTDDAGNLFLTLPGRDRGLSPLLTGSHLDTQPTGGKFDGALGVLAALEAAVALRNSSVVLARDLITIRAVRDAAGISVATALDALHAAFPDMPRRALGFRPAFYLEAHIEQGPLLEAANCPIGIVTGIQGKITWEIAIEGDEAHAGTLAMAERRDAVATFARIAAPMHAEIGTADTAVKFTIGSVKVSPNAPSVVPGRVVMRIDLRHPDNTMQQHLGMRVDWGSDSNGTESSLHTNGLTHRPFEPELWLRLIE
jgi:N-carbamoyl-L-amino-acid hydrolase